MTFNTKGLMSSLKQNWQTPKETYRLLDEEFHFDFDPCPINPTFDGLNIEWGRTNFVNPPYNETKKWIEKALIELKKGRSSIFLVPARTDTKLFHELILPNTKDIRFIKGRLKFNDGKGSAPFPSMVVIFR